MPSGYPSSRKLVSCATCGTEFYRVAFNHKYCSVGCKRTALRTDGCESTGAQYKLISGNWEKYYNRLRCQKNRQGLALEVLLALHEKQGGLCALSGVPLTCKLEKGAKCLTNASIDRINPKGAYSEDNIQLVCVALNIFRVDMPVAEFVDWCKKVSDYALRK